MNDIDKELIADKIEEALASLPDDLKAVGKLNELVAELRGEVSTRSLIFRGGGNGNGPPSGP